MIPIPEILKGKEVKEFIEYDHNQWNLEFIIKPFYSQSFAPEMVGEYFEGWKNYDDKNFKYTNSIWTLEVYNDCFYISEFGMKHQRFIGLESKTLSQFITCCKMANVELKWRSQ